MSDDSRKWDAEQLAKDEIDSELKGLSLEEKHELASLITDEKNARYFELDNLPAPAPVKASINRSEIFKAAWYYMRKNIFESFADALRAAWKAAKIKLALKAGKVVLKFRKSSGEIRTAIATLKLDAPYTPKTKATSNPDLIKFFEVDNGWRSCRIERVLSAA